MDDLKLTLQRVKVTETTTYGVLLKEEYPICLTIENSWKDNEPYVSSIPEGTYNCYPYISNKFKIDTFFVENVKGRTGIIFHPGNTHLDTHGCILPVKSFGLIHWRKGKPLDTPVYGGLDSYKAFTELIEMLKLKSSFTLEVKTN